MDGVGTSIVGRPRRLPADRRARPTYTLIWEEPPNSRTTALQRRGLAAAEAYTAGQGGPPAVYAGCGGIRSVQLAAIVAVINTTVDRS